MKEFKDFASFGFYLEGLMTAEAEAQKKALDKATALLLKKVKEKFGTYQPTAGEFVEWAQLADSTMADRERQGYPEDEPELRSGELRDSVGRNFDYKEGHVGSDSDIAVWQELGTKHMPPRSFLGSAAVENMEAIAKIVGEEAVMALIGAQVFGGRIEIDEKTATPMDAGVTP